MTNFTEMSEKTHVALVHETWRESVLNDLTTAGIIIGLWSIGHYAESAALEWIGVIAGVFIVFFRAASHLKKTLTNRMTPDEARAWLDKNFPAEDKT